MPVLLADLVVYSRRGRFVGAVEIKNLHDLTPDAATAIRRNMLERDGLPESDYLILISQEHGYLWKNQVAASGDQPPDMHFSMTGVMEHYATQKLRNAWLRKSELELILSSWLMELTHRPADLTIEAEVALQRAGLIDAIQGGSWTWETT